jgi:antitoxin (DNA-binding transcriptional repressor) of toxin-antitoxin stability system
VEIEIGSYEAKSKLPELLRQVKSGARYTITLRGHAVADLIPSGKARRKDAAHAVLRMQEFMNSHAPLLGVDTQALISQGRD